MHPAKPNSAEAALDLAKRAAARLRELGATRIVLFGSLARGTYVPGESDIDLYFEGLEERAGGLAMLAILDEFGETTVDPIPADCCPGYIKERIELQGGASMSRARTSAPRPWPSGPWQPSRPVRVGRLGAGRGGTA